MAFVQAISANAVGASSVTTAGITTNAGSFIPVGLSTDTSHTISGTLISDSKANSYTAQLGPINSGTGSVARGYLYWNNGGTRGASHTFTASVNTTGSPTVHAAEFSGRATSTPIDASQSGNDGASGVTSHTGPSIVTTTAGDDIWSFHAEDLASGTQGYTAGTNWTIPANGTQPNASNYSTSFQQYQQNKAAATYPDTWTTTAASQNASLIIAIKAAAGGGATVLPPAGSLALSGQVPVIVVTANQTVLPPAGSLTLTGLVPTVLASGNQTILPPAASLTLSGLVPTVSTSANTTVSPPAGSLTLTGLVPVIVTTANVTVNVPAGSLSLTGLAPTVIATANVIVDVPLASLTLSGQIPDVLAGTTIPVPAGSLALTGLVPTITVTQNVVINVPSAQLGLTGLTPTVAGSATVDSFSGGFLYEYERHSAARARRRRLEEEAAAEAAEAQDARDREIAAYLHAQEALDAERADAERLRTLAQRYAAHKDNQALADRVKVAYVRAIAQANHSAVEALRRELDRQLEDEEFAVLMILLED